MVSSGGGPDSSFGDLDLAEEASAEAFATAVERGPADGLPSNPGGWLTTTATRKATRLLRVLLPDDGEVDGLLSLTLLTEARRPGRGAQPSGRGDRRPAGGSGGRRPSRAPPPAASARSRPIRCATGAEPLLQPACDTTDEEDS